MKKPEVDGKLPKICDFVKWELDYFRENCNFTEPEMEYFNLRSSGATNEEIALLMYISEPQVYKIAKKVKSKMIRVL